MATLLCCGASTVSRKGCIFLSELSVVEQCVVSSDSSLAEAENLSVNCVNNHSSPSYENKVDHVITVSKVR